MNRWDELVKGAWVPDHLERTGWGAALTLVDLSSATWRNARIGVETPAGKDLYVFLVIRQPRSRWKRWLLGKALS